MSKNVTMSHHNYIMEIHTIKFHSFIMEMSFFSKDMVPKKMGTTTWCQDYRSSGNLQSSTACCGLVSLCSVIFRNFFGLSTWCCFLCNSPLRTCLRHVVHKDPYHCDSFFGLKVAFLLPVFGFPVEPLVLLSEGSLHHDPSIFIQLLDVHLQAWDPGSWYGDYGCFQKWGIQTEWWWIRKTPTPAMHSEWDTCTSISYQTKCIFLAISLMSSCHEWL